MDLQLAGVGQPCQFDKAVTVGHDRNAFEPDAAPLASALAASLTLSSEISTPPVFSDFSVSSDMIAADRVERDVDVAQPAR